MFGWFKKTEVSLSPEVNGIVTENGKPVANLEVIRSLMYIDEVDHRDSAITDENGRFSFPPLVMKSSMASKPFVENRVWQEIFIEHKGDLLPLWVATQYGIHDMPEYKKKLAFLDCELTNKRVSFEFKNNHSEHVTLLASSICRWDEDFMPFWLYDGDKEYRIHDGDLSKLTERN